MVWDECEHRYEGFTRVPTVLRIPYFTQLDGGKIKAFVIQLIREKPWPAYLQEWTISNLKIITQYPRSIEESLVNVTQPWRNHTGCKCAEIRTQLQEAGYNTELPTTRGHIFMTGREYQGPGSKVMHMCAKNVPKQSMGNVKFAWRHAFKQHNLCDLDTWEKGLQGCTNTKRVKKTPFPMAYEVAQARKYLDKLVIGPLDKNNGELWMCCPHLYNEALEKTYGEHAGYNRIYPPAMSRRDKRDAHTLDETMIKGDTATKEGTDKDIIQIWHKIYTKKGWHKYATYDKKGGFNRPYILFKAKNVTDANIREEKLMKVRPIAPGTKHPMRRLLHLAGRAWSFIATNLEGDHFVIEHCGKVVDFLKEDLPTLEGEGPLRKKIWDIVSCYPNMPRDVIRHALRDMVQKITRKQGHVGVAVPKYKDTKACTWMVAPQQRTTRRGRHTFHLREETPGTAYLYFEVLLDIMEFALDHAIIKMPNSTLLRQAQGIPMGDPLSPGMTIAACAWMEHEWMQSIHGTDKRCFKAKRYMDDIIMFWKEKPEWDSTRFIADFEKSTCYFPPLELEAGRQDTFLETTIELDERGELRHWLKNDNADGSDRIWRYQHFGSHAPYKQKRAVLTACLRKVHQHASDEKALILSAIQKMREFERLFYPRHMLKAACTFMAASLRSPVWFDIRDHY